MDDLILEAEDFLSSRLDPRFHDEVLYKWARTELIDLLFKANALWTKQ